MSFEKIVPEWNAPGVEPPESLKNSGFTVGYKPPADYFNWYWHNVSEVLKEIQAMKPETIGACTKEDVKDVVSDITPTDIGAASNPNLLHNWYFGNPVNRNGKTVYDDTTNSKMTIDRWYAEAPIILTVNTSNITVENTSSNYAIVYQKMYSEVARQYIGEKITYSILVDSIDSGAFGAYVYDGSAVIGQINPLKVGMNSISFDYSFAETVGPTIRIQGMGPGKMNVKAAKLELGDTQTLAHQDANGNWVLNEIPDYAEQMSICQQYNATTGAYIGGSVPLDGSVAMSGDLVVEKSYPRLNLRNPKDGRSLAFLEIDSYVEIGNNLDSTNYRSLRIKPETYDASESLYIYQMVNGSYKSYQIYGSHNKPSGSYTGNGSATSRTIPTGGIGNTCLVYASGVGAVLITAQGAFCLNGDNVSGLRWAYARFENGNIIIATTSDFVNKNGTTYYYEVL